MLFPAAEYTALHPADVRGTQVPGAVPGDRPVVLRRTNQYITYLL